MGFRFKLPIITQLTIEQQAVLNEPGAISVSGGPGTGKSVVSLWRHIRNHATGKRNSLLLTYTKSLEAYLRASARSEDSDAGYNVSRTLYWTSNEADSSYDEIIIDEAQDVGIGKYRTIKSLTNMVSYSSDDNQMLYPDQGVTQDELEGLFPYNSDYELHTNFRNSSEIMRFVKSMFPRRLITDGRFSGPKPIMFCTDGSDENQFSIVNDIIEEYGSSTHNIAILLPFQKNVQEWYDTLRDDYGISCSKFSSKDREVDSIENVHITTYKSSKGLEFDTVIVPDFDSYEYFIENFDMIDDNDYYVVFTRTKRNLFLIDNSYLSGGETSLDFVRNQIANGYLEVEY